MWNNAPWQKEFLRCSQSAFNLSREDLRRAILIKAFEQASFWQRDPPMGLQVQQQIHQFRMALEDNLPLS